MNNPGHGFIGAICALLLGMLVIGSILLSIVEESLAFASSGTSPLSGADKRVSGLPGWNKLRARSTPFLPEAEQGIPVSLISPTGKPVCPVPVDWKLFITQADDTLSGLAIRFSVSPQSLAEKNCLAFGIDRLIAGTTLFVPDVKSTQTAIHPTSRVVVRCKPPARWLVYTVRPGDTLSKLSWVLAISVAQLRKANCMGSVIHLKVGQKMYVPYLPPRPTSTRKPKASPTLTSKPTATETQPQSLPSEIPTATPQPPSATNTSVFTDTPQPTNTPRPTDTPLPTDTPPANLSTPPAALYFSLVRIISQLVPVIIPIMMFQILRME